MPATSGAEKRPTPSSASQTLRLFCVAAEKLLVGEAPEPPIVQFVFCTNDGNDAPSMYRLAEDACVASNEIMHERKTMSPILRQAPDELATEALDTVGVHVPLVNN